MTDPQPNTKSNPHQKKRQRKLGRGLSGMIAPAKPTELDLGTPDATSELTSIPDATPLETTSTPSTPESSLKHAQPEPTALTHEIPVEHITAGQHQPRTSFDDLELQALADSIKAHGLIQPVVLRRADSALSTNDQPRYELIAGERRWRAAKLAGLTNIPAVVRDASEQTAAEWALVENIQRTDLNPMERARALRSLQEAFKLPHAEIAARLGMSRPAVANLIRLTDLEPEIQAMLERADLDMGHGRALLAIPQGAKRIALAEKAAKENWSVRHLERETSQTKPSSDPSAAPAPTSSTERPAALTDLERKLGEHLATRVKISTDRTGKKGNINIEFFDLDHFDSLTTKMGFKLD